MGGGEGCFVAFSLLKMRLRVCGMFLAGCTVNNTTVCPGF